MIQVVQAFDRAPISQRPGDDAATLERKFAIASKLFKDRKSWRKPHQLMDVLRKLAALKEAKREHFGRQIARESGKPYTDALIETDRAIDGVRNACDILRTWAGCEIPMGLTAGSDDRRAWTMPEPIGVVAGDLRLQPFLEPDRADRPRLIGQ
jgi:acyl-CoA reductase-like NAD-dependent aldehyde dehydrogenase